MMKNYWTQLLQDIMICQLIADQLFAWVFGFGKYLICLPLTNHDILLKIFQ